ncbi:MAG: hypothetical protein AB8U93_04230 [Francisella endosymbiont of Hyalomma scupense]
MFFANICFATSNKYNLEATPIIITDNTSPDFRNIKNVNEKKKIFIDFMPKEIDEANKEICEEREMILNIQKLLNNKQDLDN